MAYNKPNEPEVFTAKTTIWPSKATQFYDPQMDTWYTLGPDAKVPEFKDKGPSHYTRLDPQPALVIKNWGLDWPKASALKYIARAGHKGSKEDELKDIQKAIDFLNLELEWLKS